jgi:protein-S-isoprenylcysteine O-methyltransferase Ste14
MTFLQPWNIVYLVGYVIFFWTRGVFGQRTKAEKKVLRQVDVLEKFLLMAMTPPTLVLPFLYLFTPLLSFADYRLPPFVPWIGVATLAASLWLFWRSHADLGRNWSVSLELRESHTLVEHGVYRHVRHPMYASIWLWAFAQGMLLENWLAGWSVVPAFAAMYFLRTPREERMMYEKFGEEYRRYMRRTGRLLPRFGAGAVRGGPQADAQHETASDATATSSPASPAPPKNRTST